MSIEEHRVLTEDGYYLGLHRIHSVELEIDRPIVLLWHGFMMSSDVWLCHPEKNNNLALVLYQQGF